MVSEGDEIDVNDFGVCRINEKGKHTAYLVEEEDGSINWYSDTVLTSKKVDFVKER